MIPRIWALLCLVLLLQHATAQSFRIVPRQDGGTVSVSATASEEGAEATGTASRSVEEEESGKTEAPSSTVSRKASSATSESEPTSTGITTNGPLDDANFINSTIPEGQLPLQPELTPGFGVAGAVLLCTGVAYTLVGIKNRWIHTFFSSAYLAALGITVLLVYIMKVPVGNALQGGYVAAVILPACLLGGASVFFKELTEGLGCALGGFCLSMWLLCLVPGGLLRPAASKAIFISCFTLVGFAFYFSRYTRDWALILMISFAGATVSVLGIDCFSRAGLKEFWAYVWDLNDDLFPLGADTYPVTKGIRVETAAIVIIFLFGIISQIKLWRIVREQKQKRAAERAAEQQDLEQQEADLGRRVEDINARERREWERVHGDGGEAGSSLGSDAISEKKLRNSVAAQSSRDNAPGQVIEMSDMSEPDQSRGPAPLMEEQDKEGKVTIRVAEDDTLPAPSGDEEVLDEKAESRRVSMANMRVSSVPSITEAPEVVPLPFNVPQEDDAQSRGDRSSVATFADEEGTQALAAPHRQSLAKRFSQSSGKLLRSFSQRSGLSGGGMHGPHGGSSEDLVAPRNVRRRDDDDVSVAATLDDSVSGDERRLSHTSDVQRKSIEITAELSDPSPKAEDASQCAGLTPELKQDALSGAQSPTLPNAPVLENEASRVDAAGTEAGESLPAPSEKAPKSATSAVSTPVSLTKDRLPRSLSKIALSYRTNEWAKHLSHAETPEPEHLDVAAPSRAVKSKKERITEEPKPVNVEELQQTAADGISPAAPLARATSKASTTAPATKRVSRQSSSGGLEAAEDAGLQRKDSTLSNPKGLLRSASNNTLRKSSNFQPIAEEAAAPIRSPVIPEEAPPADIPTARSSPSNRSEPFRGAPVPGIVSYDSPQTLIGQREMFLRSRSQGNLLASPSDLNLNMSASSATRTPSESGSLYNYPMYAAALDADDLPLSQRREFMRQSSMMSLTGPSPSTHRMSVGSDSAPNFDSHQPKRGSAIPSQADREARLASFRSSVAQDLRSGTALLAPSGRETPFASTHSLLAGAGGREAEVQRNIEMQRTIMMGQREAEGHQREMARRQKELADRAFDERMRSGDLLEAHREAMRKMQRAAKDK
ncbi:hypothetical protein NLU13_2865 [Sarocladium strictum]|uniref:TM7S3/TM198-like domain-containing protein n=1 Tax=Sarocladium strictum TaxID=5046 RepID=A0AA39GKX9_SARSR|nr:hypothetical protein NLU13_2865 [Sarocladium strictum]